MTALLMETFHRDQENCKASATEPETSGKSKACATEGGTEPPERQDGAPSPAEDGTTSPRSDADIIDLMRAYLLEHGETHAGDIAETCGVRPDLVCRLARRHHDFVCPPNRRIRLHRWPKKSTNGVGKGGIPARRWIGRADQAKAIKDVIAYVKSQQTDGFHWTPLTIAEANALPLGLVHQIIESSDQLSRRNRDGKVEHVG
jgi:hypothetical protein